MVDRKRPRTKSEGFVGLQLVGKNGDRTLFNRLEAYVKKVTLNRSQVLRISLIEYLDKHDPIK